MLAADRIVARVSYCREIPVAPVERKLRDGRKEAITMEKYEHRRRARRLRTLTLPELDQAKAAVLNSLSSL